MKKGILSFYLIAVSAVLGFVMMLPGTDPKEAIIENADSWVTIIRLLGVLAIGSLAMEYLPPFLIKLKGESWGMIASRVGLIIFVVLVLAFTPLKEMETQELRIYTTLLVVAVIVILNIIFYIWSRHIKKREEKEEEPHEGIS